MTALYLLEPAATPAWAPFHGVRPIAELRAGAWRIRERWERAIAGRTVTLLGDALGEFHELDEPPVLPVSAVQGPAVVARSDFAPAALTPITIPVGMRRLEHAGTTVAWIVPAGETWIGPTGEGPAQTLEGLLLGGTYDLVAALEQLLPADCAAIHGDGTPLPDGSIVLGDPAAVRCLGATIEPGVVFDTRHGVIVLEAGVDVRNGTRLEGPLYVGAGSRLLGGHLRASSFGPRCSVRGEVSSTVFLGYANKSHDGFVGHSVIGQWVNLGALTTTSNLKNTYGPVRIEAAGERLETGRTFLGSLIGDHAKTAIGTMLGTGTVVSAGANVFGSEPPPKWVPPFAWGSLGAERVTEDGFLRIAERVLPRRDVAWTDAHARSLRAIYRRALGQ